MNNKAIKEMNMNNDLTFCKMPLNRASHLRKNSAWLGDKTSSETSRFYFFWQGKFLYVNKEIFAYQRNGLVGNDKLLPRLDASLCTDLIFLGIQNDAAYFAYDLSELSETAIEQWLLNLKEDISKSDAKFIDFRRSLSLLTSSQASILSYAKALIHWQQSALFCGRCGHKTQAMDGGHRRLCLNESCQTEQFPRTDPAVIMLVEYQPATGPALCLLAEHHRTPEQVYSTLAGFVDPGESLTEAVIREVFEEVGIVVSDVNYVDSQPWPFPNSLMLGFVAQAKSTEINLEEEELRSADWFTAKQLAEFNDWGDDVDGGKLPRKESIARLLIDSWCEQQESKASTKT
jgi:NAD+ diphosphatase